MSLMRYLPKLMRRFISVQGALPHPLHRTGVVCDVSTHVFLKQTQHAASMGMISCNAVTEKTALMTLTILGYFT